MRAAALLVLLPLVLAACSPRAFVRSLVFERADLPEALVLRGLAYLDTGDPAHRLDVFRPDPDSVRSAAAPFVVFVHGGGWTTGDRGLTVVGADVYQNVGRYFAARGIGAAVVGYRLQPGATWQQQAEDVAAAVAYVQRRVPEWGGRPEAVVLAGHSAGGHLGALVALDAARLPRAGGRAVCGVVVASGAALDLTDRASYSRGNGFDYYARRFAPDRQPVAEAPETPFRWQVEASPAAYARADAPPFLVLTAPRELRGLRRQAEVFHGHLLAAGASSRLVAFPAPNHELGVPALSNDRQVAGPEMVRFVRGLAC